MVLAHEPRQVLGNEVVLEAETLTQDARGLFGARLIDRVRAYVLAFHDQPTTLTHISHQVENVPIPRSFVEGHEFRLRKSLPPPTPILAVRKPSQHRSVDVLGLGA